jgi:hypothetical protein
MHLNIRIIKNIKKLLSTPLAGIAGEW